MRAFTLQRAAVARRFLPASLLPAGRPPRTARAPRTCRREAQSASAPCAFPGLAEGFPAGIPGVALVIRSEEKDEQLRPGWVLSERGETGCDRRGRRGAAGEPGPANPRAISAGTAGALGLGWKWGRGLRTLYRGLLGASRPGLMTHDLVSIRGLVRSTQQSGRFLGGCPGSSLPCGALSGCGDGAAPIAGLPLSPSSCLGFLAPQLVGSSPTRD
ncbi:uncharacterized protein LOC122695587 isoform X2 [Cervus elaphus]|uniref:uncharacterized protein LOC122695587 isoform X2 n=1 Tax=Cervus elaphus TaxID=9860 RepID=UPI001CC2B446|nr:uncharacterized protein LOC122695587 isoform X2 [Cervus elaphus]